MDQSNVVVKLAVPSGLRHMLETNEVDIALCPVIDYHRCCVPLDIVPVGGIGCLGQSLTVRLYSHVPFGLMTRIHIDSDSHTSVALLQIILSQRYGTSPQLIPYNAPRQEETQRRLESLSPESMLLIGDKVITDHEAQQQYAHQLDLGQAWFELTGLPFVFAVWMARRDGTLGELPNILRNARTTNASRIEQIVNHHGSNHGWPLDLAKQYLGHIMQYEIEKPQLQAIERFGAMAFDLGLIDPIRSLRTRIAGHPLQSQIPS